jgi:hypothetical protein
MDPYSVLFSELVEKGSTGPDGVFLCNRTITFAGDKDFGYTFHDPAYTATEGPQCIAKENWLQLLVTMRESPVEFSCAVLTKDPEVSLQFTRLGNKLHLTVTIPIANLDMVSYRVTWSQQLLECVADFANLLVGDITFNMGWLQCPWSILVESGEVEEMEVTF